MWPLCNNDVAWLFGTSQSYLQDTDSVCLLSWAWRERTEGGEKKKLSCEEFVRLLGLRGRILAWEQPHSALLLSSQPLPIPTGSVEKTSPSCHSSLCLRSGEETSQGSGTGWARGVQEQGPEQVKRSMCAAETVPFMRNFKSEMFHMDGLAKCFFLCVFSPTAAENRILSHHT